MWHQNVFLQWAVNQPVTQHQNWNGWIEWNLAHIFYKIFIQQRPVTANSNTLAWDASESCWQHWLHGSMSGWRLNCSSSLHELHSRLDENPFVWQNSRPTSDPTVSLHQISNTAYKCKNTFNIWPQGCCIMSTHGNANETLHNTILTESYTVTILTFWLIMLMTQTYLCQYLPNSLKPTFCNPCSQIVQQAFRSLQSLYQLSW